MALYDKGPRGWGSVALRTRSPPSNLCLVQSTPPNRPIVASQLSGISSMLVPLLAVLPLLASSLGAAVPLDEQRRSVDIVARQRGNWGGDRGRPTRSRTRAASAASQTAAGASAPSQPAANQGAAGGASQAAPAPVASAAQSAGAGTGAAGTTAAGSSGTAAAGTAVSGTDSSDTSNDGSIESDSGTGTGAGGEAGGSAGAGSGPAGTGWDAAENLADLTTYKEAGLQWWYNWQLQPSVESIVEFVPMVKFGTDVAGLKDAMGQWPAGVQYVLSFNEPDMETLVGGTSMAAAEAAQKHREAVEILGGNYKFSTPGVSRGGFDWMDQWIAACEGLGGCHYDFVAYHYYGTDVNDLISSIKKMHTTYGKEVWLTEWDCHEFDPQYSCSPAEAEAFMKGAIEWFRGEGASIVSRWAWFGAFSDMKTWHDKYDMDGNRIANADGTINELGKTYLSL